MKAENVSILDGNTFVVSDLRGDIEGSATDTNGLFASDTRFLSRWILTINGVRPDVLSTDDLHYFAAQFFLVLRTGSIYVDSSMSIMRRRAVGNGFHEELIVSNHGKEPQSVDIVIEAGADFADLFEVKDALAKKGRLYNRVENGTLVLGYQREKYVRETRISSTQPATIQDGRLAYRAEIPPHSEWKTDIDVSVSFGSLFRNTGTTKYASAGDNPRPNIGMDLEEWLQAAPQLTASWSSLERTYRRSLVDLAALRFFPIMAPGESLPAAGLPWFMSVFGRDSILTSYQALPFVPELARTTLRVLGARQGTTVDPFRDEEPGKILHESRAGELTAFEERPHSPYFGSSDVTPLWLVLLDEYERWTGDRELVMGLKRQALAALRWIDEFGDSDGDGYVEYEKRHETSLDNQCWKDSWDSIAFRDGTLAPPPRATCEIQGYVYDAKARTARLAREIWGDRELADRLTREAEELKTRFNRDFWMEDRQAYALALDGQKRVVDSITSNIGHLLWSGIVPDSRAAACARVLLGESLYSGWGVRTMADTEGSYNPIGYHVGTVWPHDNSFIALGLQRYGFKEEAATVAMGILEAAEFFNHRLPEVFAGYPRSITRYPVEFPTASSPQAWATGTPMVFLRTMLGLEPVGQDLMVTPAIPREIASIELKGIPGRWGRADASGRGVLEMGRAQLDKAA